MKTSKCQISALLKKKAQRDDTNSSCLGLNSGKEENIRKTINVCGFCPVSETL